MEHRNEKHTDDMDWLSYEPIVLIYDVLKRFLLVVLVALVVGVGSYIVTDLSYTPLYQTSTTYVVITRSSSSTVYSNLSSTTNLATVFSELLNSSLMRKNILDETGAASFDGSIAASVIAETNLINVTVTASDPRTAFQVALAIIEHHEEITYQVVDGISLEVLQYPVVPMGPSNYPNAMGNMKRMSLAAAVAVCALLLALSWMRNTIRSGKEAQVKLDCSYLGEIPHEEKYKTLLSRIHHKKTSILITNPATSFRFLETVRKLRRRIEHSMHGRKVLMVTSLMENEGKSTVAVNLALSLAQKHKKVLLIDCDLRKPACHAVLEQKNVTAGLRDVLLGKAELSDVMIRDKKSNLYLLLETRGTKNSGDLVSSEKMDALLRWARKEFDYVVLDLPPMGEVSDAEGVMEYVDASLLVVRQNMAPAAAVNKAIASLESGRAKLLGCILNNVRFSGLSYGRGYGYGYGRYGRYGHYGHYGHYGAYDSGK